MLQVWDSRTIRLSSSQIFHRLIEEKSTSGPWIRVQDFLLAGRSMWFLPVAFSLFSSNIGSSHFIGLGRFSIVFNRSDWLRLPSNQRSKAVLSWNRCSSWDSCWSVRMECNDYFIDVGMVVCSSLSCSWNFYNARISEKTFSW